eukprot:gene17564-9194_t
MEERRLYDPADEVQDYSKLLNDSNSEENDRSYSSLQEEALLFEEAIASTGIGNFHYLLLCVCGWALASDSVEIQAVSFVLPSACDLNLTSSDKGWLNAIIFVGMMVGGYSFGGVADIKGRRFVLMWSMSLNGLFALASSFADDFLMFLFLRLMSGVGVGAAMPVVFAYFTEFLSMKNRGPMIGFLASFWMVGNIMTAGIAWFIIPKLHLGSHVGDIFYGSWRIFVALCSIPSISSALFVFLLPESPKFLQKTGRFEEAANVMTKVYKMNNSSKRHLIPPEISKFSAFCEESSLTREVREFVNRGNKDEYEKCGKNLKRTLSRFLRTVDVVSRTVSANPEWAIELQQICESHGGREPNGKYDMPRETASMVVSGVSAFFFWFVTTRTHMIIMSCIFSGLATAGWNALDVLSMELYPTHLRSTAFGIQAGVGRIGAILANQIFGLLVDVHCAIPLFLVAGLLSTGGLAALKLPKTDNEALH